MAMFKRKASYRKKPSAKRYKKTQYKKKSRKSSSRGYTKKSSLYAKPTKVGTNHWLSIGNPGYHKSVNNRVLKQSLSGQAIAYYNTAETGQLTCTAGIQGYGLITNFFDSTDITAYLGSLTKHFIRGMTSKISMTNQGNAACIVDIYDLQARNDTSATPYSLVFSTQMNYYGATLFTQQSLLETYKVNRVTSHHLAAGESIEHRTTIQSNHLFKDDELGTTFFRGLSRVVFAVIRGVAADTTADENVVGSLRAKVDFIVSKEYKRQAVNNAGTTYSRGSLMSTAADRVMELDGDETTFITA